MTIQENITRREKSRTRVLMTGNLILADGSHHVLVRDISRNGAQVYAEKKIAEGQDACFKRGSLFVAASVTWCTKGEAGLKFYRDLSASELAETFHTVMIADA